MISYPFTILLGTQNPIASAEDVATVHVDVDETVPPAERPAEAARLALDEIGAEWHNVRTSLEFVAAQHPVLAVFEGNLEPESLEPDFWKSDSRQEEE